MQRIAQLLEHGGLFTYIVVLLGILGLVVGLLGLVLSLFTRSRGMVLVLAGLTGAAQHLPTAALAHVELEINGWTELEITGRAQLANLWCPRELA